MRYLKNVVTLRYDASLCNGCGRCLEVCPHAVFARKDGKAEVRDRDACMECGACQVNCPRGALTVRAGVGCAYAELHGGECGGENAGGGCSEPAFPGGVDE